MLPYGNLIDDTFDVFLKTILGVGTVVKSTFFRDYPEEAHILFSQWDSLVLDEAVLYRCYHYLDGTTQYLQVVLHVKLRHLYVERVIIVELTFRVRVISNSTVYSTSSSGNSTSSYVELPIT